MDNLTVRGKFKCTSIEEFENGWKTAKLNAVYSNTGENADFSKFTPNGNISITVTPETKAIDFYKPGKSYYIDFTEVPAEESKQ